MIFQVGTVEFAQGKIGVTSCEVSKKLPYNPMINSLEKRYQERYKK
jgi:hypothetical protein